MPEINWTTVPWYIGVGVFILFMLKDELWRYLPFIFRERARQEEARQKLSDDLARLNAELTAKRQEWEQQRQEWQQAQAVTAMADYAKWLQETVKTDLGDLKKLHTDLLIETRTIEVTLRLNSSLLRKAVGLNDHELADYLARKIEEIP